MTARAAHRGRDVGLGEALDQVVVGGLGASTDWRSAVRDCDAVVHTAARVHVMRESAADPLVEFRTVNVEGTLQLARQAAAAGVGRFIFLSSIKVNGEQTPLNRPFTAGDVPNPMDAYGVSKLQAEHGLRLLAAESGMEVVVIRPVLVYGPGVKANFLAMMRSLARGVPLPFGAIHNRRSLVALDNLVDLIVRCLVNAEAANRTFLVSDGEDLSTTDLLRRTAAAMRKPARLIPVPQALIEASAVLVGRANVARRLCGSLTVDIAPTCATLAWRPPVDVDSALRRTVDHYLGLER
jgi:nucleoside-diphosphate-sugar epimerase